MSRRAAATYRIFLRILSFPCTNHQPHPDPIHPSHRPISSQLPPTCKSSRSLSSTSSPTIPVYWIPARMSSLLLFAPTTTGAQPPFRRRRASAVPDLDLQASLLPDPPLVIPLLCIEPGALGHALLPSRNTSSPAPLLRGPPRPQPGASSGPKLLCHGRWVPRPCLSSSSPSPPSVFPCHGLSPHDLPLVVHQGTPWPPHHGATSTRIRPETG